MFKFILNLLDRHDNHLKEEIAFLKEQLNKPCKSCETCKEQLAFTNNERSQLMETLIQLTKPTITVPSAEVKELKLAPNARGTFSRRRSILENMNRKREEVVKNSPFIAQVSEQPRATVKDITPQSVESMEQELGLIDENGAEQNVS